MIRGNVDISFLDERELYITKFLEDTNTAWSSGYWKDTGQAVPDYPYDSTFVMQTYDNHAPTWAHHIKEMFASWIEHSLVTVNCVKPGRCIPPHRDKFYRLDNLAKKHNWDIVGKTPVRINLFLQDKIMGHHLEIEDQHFTNYIKGDYTYILKDQVHCVSNVSNINRYTLQITGYAKTEDIQ
jgi:hypothetical protein|tara:strand:+ start:80 stop:625 length:546 start_codon:yes stop_codon:yes gene_type:complete